MVDFLQNAQVWRGSHWPGGRVNDFLGSKKNDTQKYHGFQWPGEKVVQTRRREELNRAFGDLKSNALSIRPQGRVSQGSQDKLSGWAGPALVQALQNPPLSIENTTILELKW